MMIYTLPSEQFQEAQVFINIILLITTVGLGFVNDGLEKRLEKLEKQTQKRITER